MTRGSSTFLTTTEPIACGDPIGLRFLMLDWSQCPAVERVHEKVSGAWVFKGTRVPVKALFENLESGARVDDFLLWFPGVSRSQIESVLAHTERSLNVA